MRHDPDPGPPDQELDLGRDQFRWAQFLSFPHKPESNTPQHIRCLPDTRLRGYDICMRDSPALKIRVRQMVAQHLLVNLGHFLNEGLVFLDIEDILGDMGAVPRGCV